MILRLIEWFKRKIRERKLRKKLYEANLHDWKNSN